MTLDLSDREAVRAATGTMIGPSRWFTIAQDDIDAFGRLTHDVAAMHMNPDWARDNAPFGGTIAYGFQTISLMTAMMNDLLPKSEGEAYKVNYGFDRLRLIEPVPAGARVRGRCTLKGVRDRDASSHIITVAAEVELDRSERPAVLADWLFMVVNRT